MSSHNIAPASETAASETNRFDSVKSIGAVSSGVERGFHTAEVEGSRPSPPTIAATRPVFVYAIQCREYVKIGRSATPEKRLDAFRTGNPFPMEIIFLVMLPNDETAQAVEARIHIQLRDRAHRLEWFSVGAFEARRHIKDAVTLIGTVESRPRPNNNSRAWQKAIYGDAALEGQAPCQGKGLDLCA